jgi:hypothetical protein
MNNRVAAVAALAIGAVLGSSEKGLPQARPADAAPIPFRMTMGDMMNTLIQPRHAKLGLAGRDRNWALAAYAVHELQQSFAAITQAIPRWRGLPVAELVEAAVTSPIAAITAAIKQHDGQTFAAAYARLTQGCNACHAAADHAFVVIKAPDASNFPNQDFSAPK